MDYLDPKKRASRNLMLFTGYILIAVAITFTAVLLLYQTIGYGIGKNGAIIQNGIMFFSSHPGSAQIRLNGSLFPSTTNTRISVPEGIYNVQLSRAGYLDWQRNIELDGGRVEHFDYPFLIPTKLDTSHIGQPYSAAPTITTQSPDRRWLLVGQPGSMSTFDVYDLKNPTKAPVPITLPDTILSKATSSESWQLPQWADDNQHVLLRHDFDGKSEFILVDRTAPEQSINLNTDLAVSPSKLTLRNLKFDQYYLYDASSGNLQTASLKSPDKTTVLQHVLTYQSYGNDTLLYVTDSGAPAGKVLLKMLVGDKATTLRNFPASSSYVVDLTTYSGTMYVAAGASGTGKVYIYKDPLGQLASQPGQAIVPAQVLRVNQPNYLSFSDSAQFIVAESGSSFGVYDIENDQGYSYDTPAAPDAPMLHAEWMDGDRLFYVTNGKLELFDYDYRNQHILVPANSHYTPIFAPDYKYVYTMVQNASGQYGLQQTWLLAPADR
ncbi:MAG TPA: PEGA domain-containing protein [Candidatus Saccharimonadia bacterium]|nr:PEGA domain-containing protein [Candidatus Saccharimonadia bacterium]